MTELAPTRRERKKQETRRRIRRAALELAQHHGIDNVTVESISEAADISVRTFFNYFPYKDDALVVNLQPLARELRDTIPHCPADMSPLRTLRQSLLDSTALRAAPAHRDTALARYRLVRQNPSLLPRHLHQFTTVEQAITSGMQVRLDITTATSTADDFRAELLASLGVAVLHLATRRWATDESIDFLTIVDRAFDLLGSGFHSRGSSGFN